MHRFCQRGRSRSSRSRRHYVFSGQRHFTSTIFADQILIVGWRLSKEAWPPGWFTFSHAMHERIGFRPLISLLLLLLLLVPFACSLRGQGVRCTATLSGPLASRNRRNVYANRIELPKP